MRLRHTLSPFDGTPLLKHLLLGCFSFFPAVYHVGCTNICTRSGMYTSTGWRRRIGFLKLIYGQHTPRVLQCVAVCCGALQCVAVCCSVLQYVAVRCSALQCVAVRCSVFYSTHTHLPRGVSRGIVASSHVRSAASTPNCV